MSTEREQAISEIEMLYPPDSGYTDTAELGRRDMMIALAENWRELPTPVLVRMAALQRYRDHFGGGR